MTGEARFLKNNFGGSNLGPMGLNHAQNEVFCHFLEFESYVFLEIAYDDSLRQFLTSRSGKTHEKIFGGPNSPKWGPKSAFSPFSQVWFISFLLNCIG